MNIEALLGRTHRLRVLREISHGLVLGSPDEEAASDPASTLLLPGSEAPEGVSVGDLLDVFVYRDSEQRPVATLAAPKLQLHEVAFLTVTSLTRYGAFVDWGLPKELLVPFAEQVYDLSEGERHPFSLMLDRTDRLCGTMRVRDLLREPERVSVGEWLPGEAYRYDDRIGLFVILERRFLGLVPASEPHGLRRGDAAQFRVTHVARDGKIELSLRHPVHEEIDVDAELILSKLSQPGAPVVANNASPEHVRALFGISRKAFKRAVGRLLRERAVRINERGVLVVEEQADGSR